MGSVPPVPDLGELQPLAEVLSAASDVTQEHGTFSKFLSSGPVTASAGDGTLADLVAQLNAASGGPSEEVKAGLAPMPQNVTILPPYTEANAIENYNHLTDISSIVSLYTAIWNADARSKRGHPEPYNITIASEAAQSFADMASSAYNVMSGPLAGFFNYANGSVATFSKEMSKTEVHLEFLGELFKGFSLTRPALLQLDGILTNFISSLKTVTVETGSTKNTVDQTLRINQVMRLNISGDDANPIWVFQPRTRIVYMHIDGSTYRWATNKAEHTSSTFNMVYTVADFDLNVNKWLASKGKLDKVFRTVSGKSITEFGKMINPNPVNPQQT
ncbi:hypothetical protein EDB81DRAFT_758575 [Dactylonectria macrodidyma]|uniref:Uncharacterized protein n=1 Tax=Dactylonectria macrodidyma TaxID=307937 RepID=A0A9P9F6M6_9HYPO|nr:hypothetical protein EDB81DRAFT_758575 [Dactylonectria macrodidyma]